MGKLNLAGVVKSVRTTISKHSPEILTGLGITGMITTTVLAVKATPKALKLIEEAEREKQEPLTKAEKVKACWKCYIPATTSGIFSAACLIGANSVNARRNAALATAYKISEKALTEYQEKVTETIGEKKEKTIREKIDKDHIERNPVSKNEVLIAKGGDTLCYDSLSGRYFKSEIEAIRRAENTLNKRILSDICGSLSLNEFYDEIGLDHIDIGYEMGWNVNNLIDIRISSHIADDDRPCVVIGHDNRPEYNFDQVM